MRRSEDSLVGQVVGANVLLVTLTLFAASVAAGFDINLGDQRRQFTVLLLAIILTLLVNMWMLKRRFEPLERLIESVERIDPAEPSTFDIEGHEIKEIDTLARSFNALLRRVDEERRRSSRLVLRAQEEERSRVSRELHDEVNQALAAMLLRLEALAQDTTPERAHEVAELKRLASQAMDELLDLARQLRPAALDDHGLVAAIASQVKGFRERTGVQAQLETRGEPGQLDGDQQTAVYRVAQEALANASRHAGARHVDVELFSNGVGTQLRVRDDGAGFDPVATAGPGLGLQGMAERARLAGGELDVRSAPGAGTEVTLRLP